MLLAPTPGVLLRRQAEILRGTLPAILDGNEEGIHVARVATRRVRELLPLIDHPTAGRVDLAAEFKAIGRALGKVRDADVQSTLMRYLESRIPAAAPSLVVVRQKRERKRLASIRSLIKQLEEREIGGLLDVAGIAARSHVPAWARSRPSWERRLRRALVGRAVDARAAIEHATGVYFPNRAHQARIALKKFRYAAEIADETAVWAAPEDIRELKKGQDVLGDMHDRQALVDHLTAALDSGSLPLEAGQVQLIVQVVEAEVHDLHAKYLARRSRLVAICGRGESAARINLRRTIPVIAGAAAASSVVYALIRRASDSSQPAIEAPSRRPVVALSTVRRGEVT
ncbi:MAG TPA: CHAD domain-containing protein [Bryobacteraceae bacterium]|jgi:CHAD domain-containing protein